MKHTGIICEYNPFHSGHLHLLDTVRAAGTKTVICLMSGHFTQRGEAAILPPAARAAMAMAAGADLVLELPFPYAAASARYFATAGVDALQRLGADTVAFGSECADAARLSAAAARTLTEDFEKKVANGAKNRGDAAVFFDALGEERIGANDILAVEYIRAVKRGGDRLAVYPVLREGAGYHDLSENVLHPSATALRESIFAGADIADRLPPCVQGVWREAAEARGFADTARLGAPALAMLRALCFQKDDTYAKNNAFLIADCGGGLLERLQNAAVQADGYHSLCRAAATKKYTDGRIRRALLYLLAGVTYADLEAAPAYLRLLGANEQGRAFLSETRKTRTVPVVTKPADITALGETAVRQRALELTAAGLYALCLPCPTSMAALQLPPVLI
ncbi:MAG: nucleotidyltransferase family protein [Ruminococcaceae bacterium]|nr:nucleotidyltransferase family protein [Oscillospiraceae bacterium]